VVLGFSLSKFGSPVSQRVDVVQNLLLMVAHGLKRLPNLSLALLFRDHLVVHPHKQWDGLLEAFSGLRNPFSHGLNSKRKYLLPHGRCASLAQLRLLLTLLMDALS